MSDPKNDDLDFDDILDDEPVENEELDKFYAEAEDGTVMFDPNADAPESVQNGTADDEPEAPPPPPVREAPEPEHVGQVTQARIDPNNPPVDTQRMTAAQRRQMRRNRIRDRNRGQ